MHFSFQGIYTGKNKATSAEEAGLKDKIMPWLLMLRMLL